MTRTSAPELIGTCARSSAVLETLTDQVGTYLDVDR